MEPLQARISDLIVRHRLLSPGTCVLAAVSGGPDSVCMAHALHALTGELGFTLRIAHLDHGLRGEASRRDALWVRDFAFSLGVSCHSGIADVASLAERSGRSIETEARTQRYRFLAQTALATGSDAIAVGHTMDDQAETVLMHLLRGSGLAGLQGMRPVAMLGAQLGGNGALTLIRPLLGCSRSETVAYCASQGILPCEDLSIRDRSISRNRIRHELIPFLESYQPQIVEILARTGAVLAGENEIIECAEKEAWREVLIEDNLPGRLVFDLARWRRESLPMQRRLLRRAYLAAGGTLEDLTWHHVELALAIAGRGEVGTTITLPHRVEATIGYDTLVFEDEQSPEAPQDAMQIGDTVLLSVPGTTSLACGWSVIVQQVTGDAARAALRDTGRDSARLAFLDAERAGSELRLRPRAEGDRFRPFGMEQGSVRVKEMMINNKIPRPLRPGWPLLANSERILWAPGLHVAADAAVTADTRLSWRVEFVQSGAAAIVEDSR